MTTPKISTIKRGYERYYVDPRDGGVKLPGVTSVVGMLPKGWLGPWSAKLVATAAVDNLPSIVGLAINGDRSGAIDYLKRAPYRTRDDAADAGTDAHTVFEQMAAGEPVGKLHPEVDAYRQQFESFLDKWQPEFLLTEQTVWSEGRYAGSFDAIMRIEGDTVIADWKTTRSGIHPEVAVQLAAYRYADYCLQPDGTSIPLPTIDAAVCLHIRPDAWALCPINAGKKAFGVFESLLDVFRWEKEMRDHVIGDPLEPSASPSAIDREARP
jgi:hypothetical protein